MKQFLTIFKYELKNYFKNKVFVGTTVFFVIALAVVMFFPRISSLFESDNSETPETEKEVMLIIAENDETEKLISENFKAFFPDYNVKPFDGDLDSAKAMIKNEEAECAFEFKSLTSFTYFVNNLSMTDGNMQIAAEVMKNVHFIDSLVSAGVSPEIATEIVSSPIEFSSESLGKDQVMNFFYAYVMIFALYMVLVLYGQLVATNVASEKSSRAMELLITSAKPTNMMFGKVLSACVAGLTQLVAIFGSALLFFNINKDYWGDSEITRMFLDIPADLVGFMILFFLLGFFVYAFLFGAIGSLASKVEDVNSLITPVMLTLVFALYAVIFSISSGNTDGPLMKFCSFFPFTSPTAMFTRIALSDVPVMEIIISVAILLVSIVGVGFISAKIYRMGVLLYGKPPKIKEVIKMLKNSK